MSTATLQRPDEFASIVADNDNDGLLENGRMDIHTRRALTRMVALCEAHNLAAQCLARGVVVIDTMTDIAKQLETFFPTIDLSPILDDVSSFVAEKAKSNQQRYQEVMLQYVADGKTPKLDEANKNVAFKVYNPDGMTVASGTGFDDHKAELKMSGGGGSGGATGEALTKLLQAGWKKFFLLTTAALDTQDERVQDMGVVQAFGSMPAAMDAVADVLATGGEPARQAEAAIEAIVEIKALRAELTNAEGTPHAAGIAAALALKTEALAITIPALQSIMPAAAMQVTNTMIDTVKVDMGARQMAHAIEMIAAAPLAANDKATAPVIKAVEAIGDAARTNDLSIADVVALVMTKNAPQSLSDPVGQLTALLAKTETIPAIERSMTAAQAQVLRADLLTPPLTLAAATPVAAQPVIDRLQTLGTRTNIQSLTDAAAHMQLAMPTSGVPPVIQPIQAMESVALNLRALSLSDNVPPAIKKEIAMISPVIETMAVQMRDPASVTPAPKNAPQAYDALYGPLYQSAYEAGPAKTTAKAVKQADQTGFDDAPKSKAVAASRWEMLESTSGSTLPTFKTTTAPTLIETTATQLTQSARATNHAPLAQMASVLSSTPSPQMMHDVIGNLRAMMISESTPIAVKEEIALLLARVQKASKDKEFEIYEDPYVARKPAVVPAYSPLYTVAEAVGQTPPTHVSPSPHTPWQMRNDTAVKSDHWNYRADNNNNGSGGYTPAANSNGVGAANPVEVRKEAKSGGRCQGCFNSCASCGAATAMALAKMDSKMDFQAFAPRAA